MEPLVLTADPVRIYFQPVPIYGVSSNVACLSGLSSAVHWYNLGDKVTPPLCSKGPLFVRFPALIYGGGR